MTRRRGDADLSVFLPLVEPREAWEADAACKGRDTDLWFDDVRRAKQVCASCPVVDDCRVYAVGRPLLVGVWGGTTWRERQTIRRLVRRQMVVSSNV